MGTALKMSFIIRQRTSIESMWGKENTQYHQL